MASLTWLGHSAFRFDTPGGKRVYVDPFLTNPKCPDSERSPERCDLIALTHAHGDHIGSTLDLHQKFRCPVVAITELADWLSSRGVEDAYDPNKGGAIEVEGIRITVTTANHTSSADTEEIYGDASGHDMGDPAGLVFELEDGLKLYFAGDTNAFMDMQLIGRLYEPDFAILPIGDHYTMGPREAAVALELLGVKRCIPCHYGTFPALHGTPDQLREFVDDDVEILAPAPGETIELAAVIA
jgi:L-ascorbate metabolism protein UlaG (beta-lactamase superfamily)